MKVKNWIEKYLIDNDLDTARVYQCYDKFLEETGSDASIVSFKRKVRTVKNNLKTDYYVSINKKNKKKEYSEKYPCEDDLFCILSEAIVKKGDVLSIDDMEDIAVSYNLPEDIFFVVFSDLRGVLNKIYQANNFHISSKKKIQKKDAELKKLKSEIKYYEEQDYSIDIILEKLDSIVQRYEPFDPPNLNLNTTLDKEDDIGVLLCSDWHYDEVVDRKEVHNINEYNIEIAKKRIDTLFEKFILNMKKLNVHRAYLYFLGDLISGNLHELAEHNEDGIIQAVINVADYISQHLQNLTNYFVDIGGLGIVGNHGRIHQKPRSKSKEFVNFERLIYEIIRNSVKNFMNFELPFDSYPTNTLNGVTFLSLHGDVIKGGSAFNSLPGTLSRDIVRIIGSVNSPEKISYVNMGHFHNTNFSNTGSVNGAKIITNGSLIGPNDYSLYVIKKNEEPTQTSYIVDAEEQRIRFLDFIKV